MKKITLLILVSGIMAVGLNSAYSHVHNDYTGWDVVVSSDSVICHILPPEGLPRQQWELRKLKKDSVKKFWDEYEKRPFTSEWYDTIPLNVVIAQDSIWIQGMVQWSSDGRYEEAYQDDETIWTYEYNLLNVTVPDAWVRAGLYNDSIVFEPRQLSCEVTCMGNRHELYAAPSFIKHNVYSGIAYSNGIYTRTFNRSISLAKVDTLASECYVLGEDISNSYKYYGSHGYPGLSIMADSETSRSMDYDSRSSGDPFRGNYFVGTFTGGRGLGMYANPRLVNVSGSGVEDVDAEYESAPALYYDLMGRSYPELPQQSGIYIYKGKKILR